MINEHVSVTCLYLFIFFLYRVENVELGDFEITGLSSFIRNALSLQLANLEIVFNLTFPLQVKANYIDFSVILGDTIPFYGGGTAK